MTQRLTNRLLDFRIGVILLIALLFRVWDLEIKPPHFDEGINGHFVNNIWRDGFYRYDPTNFHGPLYFYVLHLAEAIFGRGIFAFRFVTAIMAVGLVWMIALHRRFFGNAALWAALVAAVSPAFVFYGRYAIHETLFILLQVVFTYGFFEWQDTRSKRSLAMMAAGFFGTFAVKETFFIFFGTWAIAIGCAKLSEKLFKKLGDAEQKNAKPKAAGFLPSTPVEKKAAIGVLGVALIATAALFSGFFLYPQGLVDMFRAFMFWTKTGVGQTGHEKAAQYWLELLWMYEWPFLLALAVSPLVYFYLGRRERIVVLAAFGTWLAYTIIPYKTPWLILNFLWLLGFVLGFAIRIRPWRILINFSPIAVLILIAANVPVTYRLNFKDFAKQGEPYVYVQSTMQFKYVMDLIERQLESRPEDLNMSFVVLNRDTWPLPWLLSFYPNLKWGKPENFEFTTPAGVVMIDGSARETVEAKLKGQYFVLPFQIRDAYEGGYVYLDQEKFKDTVPEGTPRFEGKP